MIKIKKDKLWKNTIKIAKRKIPFYIIPQSIDDIVTVIKKAESENKRIKAVGSGHSFSDVALPKEYLVNLKKINKALKLPSFLRDTNQLLVHVEAGMTIQKFNKIMDKKEGLCITNMGGIDEQTLAGAISTGTHGTGMDLPSLPGLVRSILLVTIGGKKLRIEPENGISDPNKHDEKDVELKQNDQLFYSALVNLGCFGIVYSYILGMERMYYLKESKECFKWKDIKPKLEDRSLFYEADGKTPIRGVMVQVNPYKNEEKGDNTVIVVKHRILKGKPKRNLNDRKRNWLSTIFGNPPLAPLSIRFIRKKLLNKPEKLPRLLDQSLRSLKDSSYENKGYKVLYQGIEYVKVRAYDSEFAFDISGDKNNYIVAIEKMFQRAEENKQKGIYQSSPMGIRFVDKSPAYLSPEFGKKVAYIDVPFVLGTPKSDDFLMEYQEIMTKEGGIPHWGKINTILNGKPELIRKYYPELAKWEEVFRDLNRNQTFSNDFSDRLNLGFISIDQKEPLII
ncbi:FAD-binding protein [Flexithrix dorotheae]|uniref:FAD-binding protein n=1 Tax=Flexithrix dorotheae TaxID=70993 RepID=UPI00036748EE|nr:FAD-binding protein [Flexithrix dorotheae]